MKNKFTKLTFPFILFFSVSSVIFCQSYNVDYFGIVSSVVEPNMAKMTSDLYYTQLSDLDDFNIGDKRKTASRKDIPEPSEYSDSSLSFFAEITKNDDGSQWTTILHIVDKSKNQEQTISKKYDSFYKILMEPKATLQDSIRKLIENNATGSEIIQNPIPTSEPKQNEGKIISTESLSGTWSGEENIDKIVILRGGRGFVIFNNGASMNITVTLIENSNQQQILVTQNGRSNASYYPDLPRNIAMNAALSADPIQWTLSVADGNKLIGIKKTLVPAASDYKVGTIDVEWNKIN